MQRQSRRQAILDKMKSGTLSAEPETAKPKPVVVKVDQRKKRQVSEEIEEERQPDVDEDDFFE